jgi:capsular polysaccharide transport system permease protein
MLRAVTALLLREMTTAYGRSAFGYIWAVLEPVAGLMLLSVTFSLIFRAPPIGTSFPLFHAAGLLPFLGYLDISQKVASAIRFSKPLLFYPGVTFVDAIVARALLSAVTQVMVFAIVLGGIIILFQVDVILDVPAMCLGLVMALSLGLGVGTLNCFLVSVFPGWERAWAILNRPMLILSCVLFVYEDVPEAFREVLWYNPLVHVVGQVRKGIYPTYAGDYVSPLFVFGLALVTFAAGLALLARYESDIVNS